MSRVMLAPGVWLDQGPSKATTASVGFTIRPALSVGQMVPYATNLRQDVGVTRRAQMAEQKRRARAHED